jgi:SAM-dependent methyltransferase
MTRRWDEMLGHLAGALPAGPVRVLVDSADAELAGRLVARLHAAGCTDAVVREDRAGTGGSDVLIRLRTSADSAGGRRAPDADVVIDLHDPEWPVIRHIASRLAKQDRWYRTETRAFFAAKAAGWDTKFGDDVPAYAAAVAEAGLAPGSFVVDVGCGTGRALPVLRDAVGPAGTVIGLDLTAEMLGVARDLGRACSAALVLADAGQLPFADGSVDAVFAAGLLMHLPDPTEGLRSLARVTRLGGRLVLFHPSGRAALAARHGRAVRPDEPLSGGPLRSATARTGWNLVHYDDAAHRFLAIAERCASATRL